MFTYDKANGQRASITAKRNVEIIQEKKQINLGLDDEYKSFEVVLDSPFIKGSRKRNFAFIDSHGSKKSLVIDIIIKEVVVAIQVHLLRTSHFIDKR